MVVIWGVDRIYSGHYYRGDYVGNCDTSVFSLVVLETQTFWNDGIYFVPLDVRVVMGIRGDIKC